VAAVKSVKVYAMETFFEQQINAIRKLEEDIIKEQGWWKTVSGKGTCTHRIEVNMYLSSGCMMPHDFFFNDIHFVFATFHPFPSLCFICPSIPPTTGEPRGRVLAARLHGHRDVLALLPPGHHPPRRSHLHGTCTNWFQFRAL
jgi:hypothetical protein